LQCCIVIMTMNALGSGSHDRSTGTSKPWRQVIPPVLDSFMWLSETYQTVMDKSRMAPVGCRVIQLYKLSRSFAVNYRVMLSRKLSRQSTFTTMG
jgi:hypothetical protein